MQLSEATLPAHHYKEIMPRVHLCAASVEKPLTDLSASEIDYPYNLIVKIARDSPPAFGKESRIILLFLLRDQHRGR